MLIIYFFIIFLFIIRIINLKRIIFFNNKNKFYTYECRYKEILSDNILYSSQFFVLALSFILFDLEIVFFYLILLLFIIFFL